VEFPLNLLAAGFLPSLTPRPGRLACPREPSGPFYNSPIRRNVSGTITALFPGGLEPSFLRRKRYQLKTRGFPVRPNLKIAQKTRGSQ
jgi:hypothetical protein